MTNALSCKSKKYMNNESKVPKELIAKISASP